MHSLLQRSTSHHDKKNKKFNTVHTPTDTSTAARRSEQSITDPSFFDQEMAAPVPHDELLEEMIVDSTNVVNNGEAEVPGQEDGPWSVSVADAPSNNNNKKYTIYVQTPTQNLTLTRAAQEITDLHAKLRSNHPNTALPPLPGFPASGSDTTDNAKRRSSFLNTLSRLANPNPNPESGLLNTSQSITPSAVEEGTEQTMAALAAYLTLVGNHPIFRNSRAWRRFVRARTDDPQSVRAERVVKRVRTESGLGRSSSQSGSTSSLRASHNAGLGEPTPNLPSVRAINDPITAPKYVPGTHIVSDKPSTPGILHQVRSAEMTSLEMFECLISHGCSNFQFSINQISSCRVAEGGFGDIYKGRLNDETDIAIKVLRIALVDEAQTKGLKRAMREIYNWSKLDHVNVHKLLGVTIFEGRLGMVSMWMEHGNLRQYLNQNDNVDRYQLCIYIARGIAYIHSADVNMIHGDLKADIQCNILVSSDGIPKLTDFDHSVISDCSLLFSETSLSRKGGGTLRWMAPELVLNDEIQEKNKQTDIYALGMTFLETITNAAPYVECRRDAQICNKLHLKEPPKRSIEHFPKGATSDRMWALLVRCWDHSPASRPTAEEVLSSLTRRYVTIHDFEMMCVIGKGRAGKILLAKHCASGDMYALKAITKRHVLAHQELQHTLTEQAVLKRMARESRDPFVVKLWWSFHDKENLFLVMDFHPGGDLATQLARWGRLGRDRARFYAAEIVEGCEGLHAAGVIYRDLKPENILIGADGHIVLTDFGLSKEFPRKTTNQSPTAPPTPNGQTGFVTTPHWMDETGSPGRASTAKRLDRDMTTTFCGTAEYLAPEVIQGLPYSYEVDWWSFGTMLYEMLAGITPFWANNHSEMYDRVLKDELQFPDDKAMDQDTESLIRGLLQRNPALRMCEPRVKKHPYFSMIDWQHVYYKQYIPPYNPPIGPLNAGDTQNFDKAFLDMEPVIADETDHTDSEREDSDSESARTASGGKSPERPPMEENEEMVDVFDGYSFEGRDSIIIDDESEEKEPEVEDERIRDAKVLEPEVGAGPITADEETTPHTTPADLPEADREPVTPTTPTAEMPQPPVDTKPAVSPAKPKSPKPALDVAQLPPLPAEKPDELAEPVASPVTARAVTPVPPTPTPAPVTASTPTHAPAPAAPAPAASASAAPEPSPSNGRTKQKREKMGIADFDRVLDADTDDDDWDTLGRPKADEVAYNWRTGKSGNNLFARGVVDRYRLTVFRKASRPALSKVGRPQSTAEPKPSKSKSSSRPQSEASPSPAAAGGSTSPTPSDSKRRGRAGGLSIRKSTRQFLRAKSPSASTVLNNGSGLLSPASSAPAVPSLKSKSSALSGASPTSPGSSDPSISETPSAAAPGPSGSQSAGELTDSDTLRRMPAVPRSPVDETKKSKKGKRPGNKVLSLLTFDTKR